MRKQAVKKAKILYKRIPDAKKSNSMWRKIKRVYNTLTHIEKSKIGA